VISDAGAQLRQRKGETAPGEPGPAHG